MAVFFGLEQHLGQERLDRLAHRRGRLGAVADVRADRGAGRGSERVRLPRRLLFVQPNLRLKLKFEVRCGLPLLRILLLSALGLSWHYQHHLRISLGNFARIQRT